MHIPHKPAKQLAALLTACALVFTFTPANAFAASVTAYVDSYSNPVVSGTSVRVTGRAYTNPTGYEREYGIAYSTSSNDSYPYYQSASSRYSGNDFDVTLTNLRASTTYYYRTYLKYTSSTTGSTIETKFGSQYSFTTSTSSGSGSSSTSASDPVINIPRVTNVSGSEVTLESSYISNGQTVRYAGFVYSSTNTNPTRSDTDIYDQVSEANKSFSKRLTSLTKNTTYYARAYISVTSNSSSSYSSNYTDVYSPVCTFVTSTTSQPEVLTRSVSNVNATGADVTIDVTGNGIGRVVERGVVYSTSNSQLDLYSTNINTKYKSASGTTGETTVTLTDLESNTTYYARAFVRNETDVYYGETRSFLTVNDTTVTTDSVTNVTSSTATANGRISDVSSYAVTEKGFVYSKTEQKPTLNDYKASTSSNTTGAYNLELTGLDYSSTYYVRAYAKTSNSVSYGNAVTFTTTGSSVTINVTYRTLNGASVGQETITASAGQTLTTTDLKQLPSGYSPQLSSWSYSVTSSESISVAVVGAPGATGTGTGVAGAFMEGVGGYMFAPDRATTRAEVAQAIYALAGSPAGSVGMSFTDVPVNHLSKDAINYVSSKSYMQGYPDGTFKPNANITRAEVCVILNMMYSPQGSESTTAFRDIEPTDWHYKYIAVAYNNQMIYGFEDGTFKPGNTTTRAQICTMLTNSEKRSLTPLGTTRFADVPATHWAYNYIMSAAVPKP